jgi:tetratricopeptide (TPR) repeat protein
MYGQFLYHAGKLDESVQQFRATLDMEWRFWIAHICLAKSYEQQGMYREALAACDAAWEFSGGNSEALSLAGYVHAVSGERVKAEAKVQQLLEQKAKRYVPPYSLALVFAGLQEAETALQWLEEAFEDRDVHMPFLRDHKWDGLRSNGQFRQILSRVGFSISNGGP